MGRSRRRPNRVSRTSAFAALPLALIAALTVAGVCGSPAADRPHKAAQACDLYVTPLNSLKSAVARTPPGKSLCLTAGSYFVDELTMHQPITLRSAPGGQARIVGRINVSHGASGTSIRHLKLDGNYPLRHYTTSVGVAADNVTFRNNDVSNANTAICFAIGNRAFGRADHTLIVNNTIHNCGALPRTNFEHGIYLAYARGTVIRHNRIVANADRGVQLYPNVSGARIIGNVISGNGQGLAFGGNGKHAPTGNTVEHNVIAESQAGRNVGSSYPSRGPIGKRNLVARNCISAQPGYGRQRRAGYRHRDNVVRPSGSFNDEAALPRACRIAAGAGSSSG